MMTDARRIPPKEWDVHKEVISELYQKKTLAEMKTLMEISHGFRASKAQYIRKLKQWGIEKYCTNDKWKVAAQQVQKRKLQGKETEVLINGKPVPQKKLRKEIARYAGLQAESREEFGPADFLAGVIARTPPEVAYVSSIDTTHMPWFEFQDLVDSSRMLPAAKAYGNYLLTKMFVLVSCFKINSGSVQPDDTYFSHELIEWGHPVDQTYNLNTIPSLVKLGYLNPPLLQLLPTHGNNREARRLLGECLNESIDPDSCEYSSRISCSLEEITIERNGKDVIHHVNKLSTAPENEALVQLLRYAAYLSSNNLLSDTKTDNLLKWISDSGKLSCLEPLLRKKLLTTEVFASNLLVSATRLGKEAVVRTLLSRGVDPNRLCGEDGDKRTALSVAVENRNTALVRILLDAKADPNICDYNRFRWADEVLENAISGRNSSPLIAEMLISAGADVNAVGHDLGEPMTMLSLAAKFGSAELVQSLLRAGARVNQVPNCGTTALQNAAARPSIHIAEILVAAGADIDCPVGTAYRDACDHATGDWVFDYLQTPLHRAVYRDNEEMAIFLLDAGADINAFPGRDYIDWFDSTNDSGWEEHDCYGQWAEGCILQPALSSAVQNQNMVLVRLLLFLGADVNAAGCPGTPLQMASRRRGNLKLVQLLLSKGADVNTLPQRLMGGMTPLQAAAAAGDEDMVECLLQAGAHVNAPPWRRGGRTAAQAAAEYGNIGLVRLLIKAGADVNAGAAPVDGRTCLQAAAKEGRVDMIQLLLQLGADVNSPPAAESEGLTALQAGICCKDDSVAMMLLERGASVNAPHSPESVGSALCCAIENEKFDLARSLLAQGANPDGDGGEFLPLWYAANQGAVDMVLPLLLAGADVNKTKFHSTPLQRALEGNHLDVAKVLMDFGPSPIGVAGFKVLRTATCEGLVNIVEQLLSRGVSPSKPLDLGGMSPLLIALGERPINEDMVTTLLKYDVDVNENSGKPLQAAAAGGSVRAVRALLKAGAEVNAPALGAYQKTALQGAVLFSETEVVYLLLDAGADINAAPSPEWGHTALQAAVKTESVPMVRLLLSRGADVNGPPSQSHGATALQRAAIIGHLRIALMLLEEGADINAEPAAIEGRTALEAAAEHGRLDLTYLFLRNDRDPETLKRRCKRAAELASSAGHHVIARIVREWKRDNVD